MLTPVSCLGREVYVQWLDGYPDGTIMAALVDDHGRMTHACIDGRQRSPTRFRFFEMYADADAYEAHIASAHFRKYVAATKSMITFKRLIETTPVQLSAKARGA